MCHILPHAVAFISSVLCAIAGNDCPTLYYKVITQYRSLVHGIAVLKLNEALPVGTNPPAVDIVSLLVFLTLV